MRKAFLSLSLLFIVCLWGGYPASAQAPQYHQYPPQYQQPQYQQPQYQQPQYQQSPYQQPQYQQPQYQQQYRPGAQVPGTVHPGAPYAGAAPYGPRGPVGPGGRLPGGRGGVSALTVGECSNLGCSVREDSSCPAIVHDYHTRHWACQCGGGSSCVNESSPY